MMLQHSTLVAVVSNILLNCRAQRVAKTYNETRQKRYLTYFLKTHRIMVVTPRYNVVGRRTSLWYLVSVVLICLLTNQCTPVQGKVSNCILVVVSC